MNELRSRLVRAVALWTLASALLAAVGGAGAQDDSPLGARLRPLIDAHRGRAAVAVKHLDNGEAFAYRADDVMPTASLIKLPVLVALYRQAEERRVDLAAVLTLREEDKVPGSGVLTKHFSPGATFTLRDAARLMIALSDNTASAGILDAPAGPIALVVLTAENDDRSWSLDNAGDRFCADVAREVYEYFNP